jgi:hypothetical protein
MPYPNEHAARIRDPGLFIPDSFRSKELKPGIRVIMGKLKFGKESMVVQTYRFSVDKFTVEEARQWLKDNKVAFIKFEPAEDQKESEIKHYGVPGMRWGVRNAVSNASGRVKGHIKSATTSSDDHLRYKALRKKKLRDMSDDELRSVVKRMKLVSQYRRSGEFKTKQTRAMSNQELERGVNRHQLRKAIVRSRGSIRFKDFIRSFKMSSAEAKTLTERVNMEKDFNDIRSKDYESVKKLINIYLQTVGS